MKEKITLKKKSWKDISINDYYELTDIIESDLEPLDKNVQIISVLCGVSPEEIYALPMYELNDLTAKMGFILDFKWDRKFRSKHLTIAGKKYDVCIDLQDMTISQYIDFQTFWGKNDLRRYYGNVLACFLIPEGKSYCEGYDVKALAQEFREKVSITLANAVCFFFLKRLLISTKATTAFLAVEMKRMKKKKPNQETLEAIMAMEMQLKKQMHLLTERYSTGG